MQWTYVKLPMEAAKGNFGYPFGGRGLCRRRSDGSAVRDVAI
jgi:hypothetical protein